MRACGGDEGARTPDLDSAIVALSQLSYIPIGDVDNNTYVSSCKAPAYAGSGGHNSHKLLQAITPIDAQAQQSQRAEAALCNAGWTGVGCCRDVSLLSQQIHYSILQRGVVPLER